MQGDVTPEKVMGLFSRGRISPLFLFYGPDEFRMEKALDGIREALIPVSARELNLRVFSVEKPGSPDYVGPGDILETARSLPFMASMRLIIVRRTETFPSSDLEIFLDYIQDPVPSTCLIFLASKPDFRMKFYQALRKRGVAVNFKGLHGNQVVPWIERLAAELGLKMEREACEYLHEVVGDNLRDLSSELEKLSLRYGMASVGLEDLKSIAVYSRVHSIFELMDEISSKRIDAAVAKLRRFLEGGDEKSLILQCMAMLERQVRLLWRTLAILGEGGSGREAAQRLKLRPFQVEKLVEQSKKWTSDELERALELLRRADGRLKSGSSAPVILENLVFELCR